MPIVIIAIIIMLAHGSDCESRGQPPKIVHRNQLLWLVGWRKGRQNAARDHYGVSYWIQLKTDFRDGVEKSANRLLQTRAVGFDK